MPMLDDDRIYLDPPEQKDATRHNSPRPILSKRALLYNIVGLTIGLLLRVVYDAWQDVKAHRTRLRLR